MNIGIPGAGHAGGTLAALWAKSGHDVPVEFTSPRHSGKVVLDAMNPFPERDGEIAIDIINRKIAAGQASQERFPSVKIVRAFSSIRYLDLQSQASRTPPRSSSPLLHRF